MPRAHPCPRAVLGFVHVHVLVLVLLLAACGGDKTIVTGETLLVVDTDMPVPAHVARLRVDLYTEAGAWYATRDVSLARPSDWPTSFGVALPDDGASRAAIVRLRAYPEGAVRDYRGERFAPRPPLAAGLDALADVPPPPATDMPRLAGDDGVDRTPDTEPEPLLAIDRLVRVAVAPGVRGSSRVVLRGTCVGTMADLAGRRTCESLEGVLAPVTDAPPDDGGPPLAGTFAPSSACAAPLRARSATPDGTPLFDEEACVPGAMFRFGSADGLFGAAIDLPARVAVVDAFRADVFEVTVGRYRAAVAAGFTSPDATPTANEGPLPATKTDYLDPTTCTYSATPRGRETLALTCVSSAAARALCRFYGGDLPTEVEWEYMAAVAGRTSRTRFAWGGPDDVAPSCDRAVWGRGELDFAGQDCVAIDGYGPLAVDARAVDGGDVTPSIGLVGVGGGVAEWTRDAFAPLTANCWAAAGLHEPSCDVEGTDSRLLRGGSWRDNVASLIAASRREEHVPNSGVGVRCTRPGS